MEIKMIAENRVKNQKNNLRSRNRNLLTKIRKKTYKQKQIKSMGHEDKQNQK